MDSYRQEIKKGMRIVEDRAAERLPGDVGLSWIAQPDGSYALVASKDGRVGQVLSISGDDLADIPGSLDDPSGTDTHWARVRAFVDAAVEEYKATFASRGRPH